MGFRDRLTTSLTLNKSPFFRDIGAFRVVYFFPLMLSRFITSLVRGVYLLLDPMTRVTIEIFSSYTVLSVFIIWGFPITIYSNFITDSCALLSALYLKFSALACAFFARSINLIADLFFSPINFLLGLRCYYGIYLFPIIFRCTLCSNPFQFTFCFPQKTFFPLGIYIMSFLLVPI